MDKKDYRRHVKEIVGEAARILERECMAAFDKMTEEEKRELNATFYDPANDEHVPYLYYLAKNVLTTLDANDLFARAFRAESMEKKKRKMLKVLRRQV